MEDCDFCGLPDGIAVLAIGPQRGALLPTTIRPQASCHWWPTGHQEDSYELNSNVLR